MAPPTTSLNWETELESAIAGRNTYDVAAIWEHAIEDASLETDVEIRLGLLWRVMFQSTRGWSIDKRHDIWTRLRGCSKMREALLSTPLTREQLVGWWEEDLGGLCKQTVTSWCETSGGIDAIMDAMTMEVSYRHRTPGAVLYPHVARRWPDWTADNGWLQRVVDYRVNEWQRSDQAVALRPHMLELLSQALAQGNEKFPTWHARRLEEWWEAGYLDQEFLETLPNGALNRLCQVVPEGSKVGAVAWRMALGRATETTSERAEARARRKM